jgi:hypothetical protein
MSGSPRLPGATAAVMLHAQEPQRDVLKGFIQGFIAGREKIGAVAFARA